MFLSVEMPHFPTKMAIVQKNTISKGLSTVQQLTSTDNEIELENSVEWIYSVGLNGCDDILNQKDLNHENNANNILFKCNQICFNKLCTSTQPGEGAGKCARCGGVCIFCFFFLLLWFIFISYPSLV